MYRLSPGGLRCMVGLLASRSDRAVPFDNSLTVDNVSLLTTQMSARQPLFESLTYPHIISSVHPLNIADQFVENGVYIGIRIWKMPNGGLSKSFSKCSLPYVVAGKLRI